MLSAALYSLWDKFKFTQKGGANLTKPFLIGYGVHINDINQ
jgi:hypothetical protein